MKNLISYPKHALSTLFLFFAFLMIAEAQHLVNYSQIQREEGMLFQRVTHDGNSVRQCVMNFHSDVMDENNPNSATFDYVYLRASSETDENAPNNMVITDSGMMMVSVDNNCARLAPEKANAEAAGSDVKLYVNGSIAVNDGNATNLIVSDGRFKKNIEPLENSLDIIRNSNFVEYQYNNSSGISSDKKYYGIIAQEMKQVLPSTVMEVKKKIRASDKNSSEFLMFNPNDLFYSGLNAIKELDAENQLLKETIREEAAKNEALEERVEELERLVLATIAKSQVYSDKSADSNLMSAKLYQNTPNPSKQFTNIEYYLPANTKEASINIQDLNGRIITQFVLQDMGYGSINFDSEQHNISSGTYVYSLVINNTIIASRKLVISGK